MIRSWKLKGFKTIGVRLGPIYYYNAHYILTYHERMRLIL